MTVSGVKSCYTSFDYCAKSVLRSRRVQCLEAGRTYFCASSASHPIYPSELLKNGGVADVMMLCIVQAEAITGYAISEKDRIESERLETVGAV